MTIENELKEFKNSLQTLDLREISKHGTQNVAFISVDMIEAFAGAGALASQRVGAISQGIAKLFSTAYKDLDFKNFILIEDRHTKDSKEFESFLPHALLGTSETETIKEIKKLSFFKEIKTFYKNSLSIAFNKEFNNFLDQNPQLDTFIVTGNCTDMCVYQCVSYLKLRANEYNQEARIIVPFNLTQTYDVPGHNGDFYHEVFSMHMKLALGADVVKDIKF